MDTHYNCDRTIDRLQETNDKLQATNAHLVAALEELDRHFNSHLAWVAALEQSPFMAHNPSYWDHLVKRPKEMIRAAIEGAS